VIISTDTHALVAVTWGLAKRELSPAEDLFLQLVMAQLRLNKLACRHPREAVAYEHCLICRKDLRTPTV
jgi:hypothetical protein